MKYLQVEGAGRLRLRGGIVRLGSTSRRLEWKESPIQSVLFRSPIWLARPRRWPIFDLINDDRWWWALLLEFEAEAMSSVSPFLISVFATIRRLGLLPYVFRLGFGFFFLRIHGPWVCYHLLGLPYVVFFFRLGLLSHLLFRIDVGLWAMGLLCYIIIIIIIFQILA